MEPRLAQQRDPRSDAPHRLLDATAELSPCGPRRPQGLYEQLRRVANLYFMRVARRRCQAFRPSLKWPSLQTPSRLQTGPAPQVRGRAVAHPLHARELHHHLACAPPVGAPRFVFSHII